MKDRFDIEQVIKILGLNIRADMAYEGADFDVACKIARDKLLKAKEYEDLEDQGKLVKFPCAVGDKLYEPRHDRGMVTEYIVTNISYFGNNYEIFISWKLNSGIYSNLSGVHASEIGKTVFLTQEEAEAALKEVGNEK